MLALLSSLLRSTEGRRWSCTAYRRQPGGGRSFPGNLGQPPTCPCTKKRRSQTCSADFPLLRDRLWDAVSFSWRQFSGCRALAMQCSAGQGGVWDRMWAPVALSVLGWICLEPAEHLQSRRVMWQLCGHGVRGGASDVMCMMNMKRHLPYVSTDIVIQLCLSCCLPLSAGKPSQALRAKDQLGYSVF